MIPGFNFLSVSFILFLGTAIPVAIMIILEKRSPFKTAAWILALILLPIIGVVFYLFFGQEFRKRKLFSRKGIRSLNTFRKLSFRQLRQFDKTLKKPENKLNGQSNIIRLLLNNSNALLTTGNRLEILNNAIETFPALFDAIEKAKHHIHLEYYIIDNDKTGNQLKTLLIKKSRQGIQVRVIIDDVGSWGLPERYISQLRKNGVEIYSFMEVRFPRLTSRVNFRNHRKILIVDGKVGFTGGINIADRYLEGVKKVGPWHDLHLKMEGDAVACLQVVFAADWYFVTRKNLTGIKYFPPLSEEPGIPVQISASGPDSDWESISQAFFAAIANAKNRVCLVTPYLMPPPQIIAALKTASLSNVDVRIIIPEKSDSIIPRWSSFSYVEELLEAGIKIYFFQKGFIHSKYLLVDENFASIGTTNLDFRSLETNFEVNAFIFDESFNARLHKQFKADLRKSRAIRLKEWKQRHWHFKLRESLAHIISPML